MALVSDIIASLEAEAAQPDDDTNALVIQTFSDVTNYLTRTRLDGQDYNLRFRWNEREDRWYLDIASDADVPIVSGIKLIANYPLLRFYQWDERMPPGEMFVYDPTNDGTPPSRYELGPGLRCELFYFPKDPTL